MYNKHFISNKINKISLNFSSTPAEKKISFSKHLCKICINEVKDNDPAVLCNLCGKWVHTASIGIEETQYENLKRSPLPWYCPYCIIEFPFSSVNNKYLHSLALSGGPTNIKSCFTYGKKNQQKTKEFLKKFREMNQIFDQSNNLTSCDYYDIPEFKKMKIRGQQDLSMLHLNISSISAHINNLSNFINLVDQKIDITCISESRISIKNPQTTNIDLPGSNTGQTPTESSAGGALIYISESLSYKPQKDFHIYCEKELESVFIELLIPNKKNHLFGVIYKHPTMKYRKFNNDFMNTLFDKLTKEDKLSVISCDFNFNLINYTQNRGLNQFLENILSNNFIPHITLPTRVTEKSATLIDNIFTNNYEHNCVSDI